MSSMNNEIKWANAEAWFKEEFKDHPDYKYITVDPGGSVCAWYDDKPWYGKLEGCDDEDVESWLGGDLITIGRICDVPDYIEYDELIYARNAFSVIEDPSNVKVKEFSAREMRKLSDVCVQSVLYTNVRDTVEHAARTGSYSTFCWLEWLPALQRSVKANKIRRELEQLGFSVNYEEDTSKLHISW